jgi:hypothetical protein
MCRRPSRRRRGRCAVGGRPHRRQAGRQGADAHVRRPSPGAGRGRRPGGQPLRQFKTPFGFEQLYGDPRLLTEERSLVNDRLTLSRQLGAQVAGDLLEKRVSYAVGAFNGNSVNNNFNDNDKFVWVGRLSGIPWQKGTGDKIMSWAVGTNAYKSDDTALAQGTRSQADAGLFAYRCRGASRHRQ